MRTSTQQAMRQALTILTPAQLRERADGWMAARQIPRTADPMYRAMAVESVAREVIGDHAMSEFFPTYTERH